MAKAIINARAVDGADIQIRALGVDLQGFESISYEKTPDHQLNYGQGRDPYSWSQGRNNYSGSITLYAETIAEIERSLPTGQSLTDIPPFQIVVTYVQQPAGVIIKDIVTAKFAKNMRGGNTGDQGLRYELDLFIVDIVFNAA